MQSVFITGAAAGIGLATAKHFAARGWFVGLYDVNRDALARAVVDGGFTDAHSGYCDVTDRESIDAALQDFASRTGGEIKVVVNNAGVLTAGPFVDIHPDDHDSMIDVNVRGFTHVAQLAFPYLRATPAACLVNLCSASSIHGIPNLAVYSATKFYVNAITQALHVEWAPHDIRVTCVKPGLVNTPMAEEVTRHSTRGQVIDLSPEDIAAAIEKAALGDRISYVVGRGISLWALLDKLLPERFRMRLAKRLAGGRH